MEILFTSLAGVYVYFFTDWLHAPRIQVTVQSTPSRFGAIVIPFKLDGKYKLTEVKVISLAALATNRNARAVWHLVKSTNAPPVSYFAYGAPIAGLKPPPNAPDATMLEARAVYRLFVRAGRARGELDFRAPAVASE